MDHQGLLRQGRRVRWLRWHDPGLRTHGAIVAGASDLAKRNARRIRTGPDEPG